ncbi:MAG: hypothetical protein Q8P67_10970 [archaeon]|nr:hypothetical protein [archaeon]
MVQDDSGWWEGVIFGTTTLGVFPGANVKPLEPEIAMQTSPRPHEASHLTSHENTPLPVGCPLPFEQPLPRGRRPLRASASLNESRSEGIVAQSTDNATHLERCQSLLEGPLPVDPEPLRALLARLKAAVQETEFLLAQLE